jgi:hypothetical protein
MRTAVGRHCVGGQVIMSLAGIGSRDRGDSPTLFDPKGYFRCMNHRPSMHHSAFDEPAEQHW